MVKRSSIIDKVFWQFNLLWLWILNPRTQDNAVYASSYVLSVMGAVFVLQVFNVPQSIFFFIPSMLFTEFVIGKTYWERTRSVWVGGCTVAVFTFCATLVPPVPVITLTAGFFLAFICYYLSIFGMKGSIYGAFSVIFSILGLGMSGGMPDAIERASSMLISTSIVFVIMTLLRPVQMALTARSFSRDIRHYWNHQAELIVQQIQNRSSQVIALPNSFVKGLLEPENEPGLLRRFSDHLSRFSKSISGLVQSQTFEKFGPLYQVLMEKVLKGLQDPDGLKEADVDHLQQAILTETENIRKEMSLNERIALSDSLFYLRCLAFDQPRVWEILRG